MNKCESESSWIPNFQLNLPGHDIWGSLQQSAGDILPTWQFGTETRKSKLGCFLQGQWRYVIIKPISRISRLYIYIYLYI